MTDTHSHMYGPEFDEDRELAIQRAREAGVERILLPNINLGTIAPMLDLCRRHADYCYPMLGLHPEDVKDDWAEVLRHMEELLQQPDHPYVAVGEVGLDFYWDTTYKQEQLAALERQIAWASRYGLPLVVHCRAAHHELVEVMARHRGEGLTGIFHCFGGTLDEARDLLQFDGFVLGIGGTLTYKKSTLPEVVSSIPLERMVLETDSPYLAPVPHRGKRNESAYVADTLLRLAQECGRTPREVEEVTERTVLRLFPRLRDPIHSYID